MSKLEYTGKEAIHEAHARLKQTFLQHKLADVEFRKTQLRQLAYLIQENTETLVAALEADLGRPAIESFSADINPILGEIHEALTHVDSWVKPHRVSTDIRFILTAPKVHPVAKGLVLIIGAWNYPLTLLLTPLVGALAAGNTVILKPSELAQATAAAVTALVPKYLDTDVVSVVNGGVPETTELLKLKWDHIFFTGSTPVGRIIGKAAGEQLTPVTLELGGKSPAIVLDDANLSLTANRLVWGKFFNQGQTCIAPDYVLCSKAIEPKLAQALRNAAREFYKKTPTPAYWSEKAKTVGRNGSSHIINDGHYARLNSLIDRSRGEIVKYGPDDPQNRVIPVTVARRIDANDALLESELFGPILPILSLDTRDDFVDYVNAHDQPLALYVFSKSDASAKYIFDRTRSGSFVHNGVVLQFVIPGLPFGGVGESGIGNYHGRRNFDTFVHERGAAKIPSIFELALTFNYPPYSNTRFSLVRHFLGAPRITSFTGSPWKARIIRILKIIVLLVVLRRILL